MNSKQTIASENLVDRVVDNRSENLSKKVYINKLISRHNTAVNKRKNFLMP